MKTMTGKSNLIIKAVTIALIICMALIMVKPVKAADSFSDVTDPGKSYYKTVYWAVENGIAKGYKDGTFRPDNSCTRAQFVTFIWRMAGKPKAGNTSNPFSDVNASMSSYKAIIWAVEKGIIKGYKDGTFRPQEEVLRRQVAVMLWRMAGKMEASTSSSAFADVSASDSCYRAVTWGQATGIMRGSNGNFHPADLCKRQQVVTFLYRYDRWLREGSPVSFGSNPKAAATLKASGGTLASAFCWSRDITYVKDQPYSDTLEGYADYSYDNGVGDCIGKATSFCFMARELGYNAHVVRGQVPLARGGWGEHAWVEIDMNGGTYVFDPQFEQQTGRNGYQIYYGQSGTWIYSDYARAN